MFNRANSTVFYVLKGGKEKKKSAVTKTNILYFMPVSNKLFQAPTFFHLKTKSCDKGLNKPGSLSQQQILMGQ